ncbi:uncharacterized protein [Salminus brasiliensis]|uniref:uncharacterized protein n=1 Tax=Salminus brasiliensis TaxID=930266 RepID=UPI003B830679
MQSEKSEKAATGRRVLHPAQDYCRLCLLQGPALSHGQERMDGPCLSPVDSLSLVQWRGDLPVPFPPEVRMPEDSLGYPDLCIPQRRHIYLGPNHYPVPESCSPHSSPCYSWREVRACRWDWPVDPRPAPCACVWEQHRDCGCARQWYPPEMPPHPFNGSSVSQLLPAKVRGQRYYREARYVSEEHYWDCESESNHRDPHLQGLDWDNLDTSGYNGHCEKRHVRFEGHDDEISCDSPDTGGSTTPAKTHCNGSPAFFSTEVPQSKFRSSRTSGPRLPASRAWGGETKMGQTGRLDDGGGEDSRRNQRKSQGTVRQQIKQVVTELEDVLGGLKQVQLEMKEVVQQIDILTSNIDLGEEELRPCNGLPQDPRHKGNQGNRFGVVALVHNSNGDMESLLRDSSRPGQVKSRTTHSLSDHSIATSRANSHTVTKNHTNPSTPVHSPFVVESAGCRGMNHTSATETQRTISTANGDCLRARPPRVRVKDLQHQRSRVDHVVPSKSPEPCFALTPTGISKSQKPPPYPQNGQLKMLPQDLSHSSNALKIPPFRGKQKQLSSTMV